MYEGNKIFALIPARGGSRGLPKKNLRFLAGKPLISWTIDVARENVYVDKIVVSTEDKEIALLAKRLGAEVPFIRPKKLATDSARGIDVVLQAVHWFDKKKLHLTY